MELKPTILIINDGNRRWAKEKNLTIKEGYEAMVKTIALICDELKSKQFDKVYITLCSKSNLLRDKEEVDTFYEAYLLTPLLSKNKLRIELHGNIDLIPEHFKEKYNALVNSTASNTDFTLHYMVNWSLDDEIIRIYKKIKETNSEITESTLLEHSDIKDPIDLIIRTGNRKRLSSCIPLNSPFAEIFFLDILFPDFTSHHLDQSLDFYNNQIRTYGK